MQSMRILILLLLPTVLGGCTKQASSTQEKAGDKTAREYADILANSDDIDELTKAGVAMCRSRDPKDVDTLLAFLRDAKFLARLDSEKASYANPSPVGTILEALAILPDERDQKAIGTLISSDIFMANGRRQQNLMKASAKIRNPSPVFLDTLESQTESRKMSPLGLVTALAQMRSIEACKRMEKWLDAIKTPLLLAAAAESFIEVRNELGIVCLCRELLTKGMDELPRNLVVEVLFDDRPMERLANTFQSAPRPPARFEASTEVLEELRKIAKLCGILELNEDTRKAIKKGDRDVDAILNFRRNDGPRLVVKLVEELDSNVYAIRQTASASLEKYGVLAEPGLRTALRGNSSVEAKARIQQILAKLDLPAREIDAVPGAGPTVSDALHQLFQNTKNKGPAIK